MGEENITFADLSHVISKEFKVLEDKIDAKFASYRNELQELAREPVTRENLDISDLPRGSAPTVGCTEQPSPTVVRAAGVGSDTQGEFQTLKDSLSRLKLPSELKLNESRQGIQRADQAVYHVLTRCARYSETSLKLLSTIEPGTIITAETLEQFFLINQAQIQYLQDEYASILVNSQFDTTTSKLFRALQKNTSGLNASALETLRSAASLSAAAKPPASTASRQYSTYNNRGQYRGGSRGGYRSGPDTFDRFSRRQFPTKRRPEDGSSDKDIPDIP